jgi:flagellar basal body-associated protein FliL
MSNQEVFAPEMAPIEIVEEFIKVDFAEPSNSKLPEILISVLIAAILLGGVGYFVFTILKKRGVIKSSGMEKVPTEDTEDIEETKAEIV